MAEWSRASSRLVVIGGGAAGMSAASRARRAQPDLEISVFERSQFVSFGLCGLPYYVADIVNEHGQLIAHTPAFFRQERNISVHVGHVVEGIDLSKREVAVANLANGARFRRPFDRLVIAAGGEPILPAFVRGQRRNLFTLRSIEDGVALKRFLGEERPRHAVIIGAGYVGLEMAEAFAARGLQVTMVEALDEPLPGSEPEVAAAVREELARNGVALRTGERVRELADGQNGGVRQVITDKGRIDADLVLLATGIRADSSLARSAGVPVGSSGALRVDRRMETERSGVFAAGDCAEHRSLITGRAAYLPLGTTANKQGLVAGENAAGGYATFAGIAGTSVVKVFALQVARTGLNEKDARDGGFAPRSVVIRASSRAGYYPGAAPVTVKLIADGSSGRVLGAQMCGHDGVAKRIDVIAAALHGGMTVADLYGLDLSYSPPFAPVWDPVAVAARVWLRG